MRLPRAPSWSHAPGRGRRRTHKRPRRSPGVNYGSFCWGPRRGRASRAARVALLTAAGSFSAISAVFGGPLVASFMPVEGGVIDRAHLVGLLARFGAIGSEIIDVHRLPD